MKMLTPDGIETDVHESSVQRKLNAGWKLLQQAEDEKANPKPLTNPNQKGG
jgi:hypothetical protein